MLKDSRVKVNEPDMFGYTPLWWAASEGYFEVLKWWIASGREVDLGILGDWKVDVVRRAMNKRHGDVATLLKRFKKFPGETRHQVRVELGLVDELAAEMFALVIFFSDGLLQIKKRVNTKSKPAARFFRIASRLPLELQMVLCCHVMGSAKEIISGKDSEAAFKILAKLV